MSSLLQHGGPVSRRRVGLVMAHVVPSERWPSSATLGDCDDQASCPRCGRLHPVLWIVWRRPVGMFGQFVMFEYNGEVHAPDLSIPISVFRLPRGAKRMTVDESSRYWHGVFPTGWPVDRPAVPDGV